jgi:hypothetical protein
MKIQVVQGFLSPAEIRAFLSLIDSTEPNVLRWNVSTDDWHDRVVFHELFPVYLQEIGLDICHRIAGLMQNRYGLDRPVYPDYQGFIRWREGDEMSLHADKEFPDGAPHPYSWREYSSMVYLNDAFSGGEIYFPQHSLEIKPSPGMLVMFPGDLDHMHGVRSVRGGVRYNLSSFWGFDSLRCLPGFVA